MVTVVACGHARGLGEEIPLSFSFAFIKDNQDSVEVVIKCQISYITDNIKNEDYKKARNLELNNVLDTIFEIFENTQQMGNAMVFCKNQQQPHRLL